MGKHLKRAEVLFNQGRYELAEKELRSEIAQNPQSANAHALLSMCLINQKKQPKNFIDSIQFLLEQQKLSSEELESIEYALSIDSNNAWYHYVLTMYWYRCGNLDRAKNQIEVALGLNPNSAYFHYILACILFDLGNLRYGGMSTASRGLTELFKSYFIGFYLKPVFAPLKRSLALDPNSIAALNLLTNLYVVTGKYKQALESSLTALARDPNNAMTQDLHGQILTGCGKYTEAIGYFQTALSIDPNYTQAKNNLLEAMRCNYYWIYPWINLNHGKSKVIFIALIPMMFVSVPLIRYILTGSVNTPMIPWENLGFFITFFFIVIGVPSQWIFNYFLIKDKKTKFLLTNRDAIIANYALSLSLTSLSWMYSCLSFSLDSPLRSLAMNLVGITGGILVTLFTFSAVRKVKFPILPIVYQAVVGIAGLINLILYFFKGGGMLFSLELFVILTIATPAVAIYNCQTTE
jgi:tetratricopeptide (TPR) repeat protein